MKIVLPIEIVVVSDIYCDNACPYYTRLEHYKLHFCKLFDEPLQKVKTDKDFWYNLRCQKCIDKEQENQ